MTRTTLIVTACVCVVASTAPAAPYWVTWEGDDFPENQGWRRIHGPDGKEAIRTLNNGVLSYDSSVDPWLVDYSDFKAPGLFQVGVGETFVVEWGLHVQSNYGPAGDHVLALFSDDAWGLGIRFETDALEFSFEDGPDFIYYDPGFHAYRLVTTDFRSFDFFIDEELARGNGSFWEPATSSSFVAWGDSVFGASSRATWDYFRFGVIPEPATLALLLTALPWTMPRRTALR